MEITKMPIQELLKDKQESIADIANCSIALSLGVTVYSGGSVQERLNVNQKIVGIIGKELERRGVAND